MEAELKLVWICMVLEWTPEEAKLYRRHSRIDLSLLKCQSTSVGRPSGIPASV